MKVVKLKKSLSVLVAFALILCSFLLYGNTLIKANAESADADAEIRYSVTLPQDETIYGPPAVSITPFGGAYLGSETETISYSRRESEQYTISYGLPRFTASYPGSCANTSGGIALGYYDIFYDNIIPGHSAGFTLNNKWAYRSQDAAVNTMFSKIYDYMGTTLEGTTVEGYKNGLTTYVNEMGQNISFSTSMSGTFDMNICRTAIQSGKLISLFIGGFAYYLPAEVSFGSGTDVLKKYVYTGNHSIVGYGYRIDKYYDANNNLFKQYNYLYANSGLSGADNVLIRLYENSTVDEAWVTHIY